MLADSTRTTSDAMRLDDGYVAASARGGAPDGTESIPKLPGTVDDGGGCAWWRDGKRCVALRGGRCGGCGRASSAARTLRRGGGGRDGARGG